MVKKLAAIYNVWADTTDLLPFSIDSILPHVDVVIVVYSEMSNYGVVKDVTIPIKDKVICIRHEPNQMLPAHYNETRKRQAGLDVAKELGCTHFLIMDGDELYTPELFAEARHFFSVMPEQNGIVVPSVVYFKSPTLYVKDTTLVPFIHRLQPHAKLGHFKWYPYAYDDRGIIRIDPTRHINYPGDVVLWEHHVMHHYSWVRRSFVDKIENSTARSNIKSSTIIRDLSNAKEGAFCEFYGQTLQRASVDFNIPELSDDTEIFQLMAGQGTHRP